MVRRGFRMKLYPGMEEEYKKRHDELWPEMVDMIRGHGGRNYSIFLDPATGDLFGYIELDDESLWQRSAETEICKKWWDYMAGIMETNSDNSPVSREMKPVFHLE
jgi:L-rhamnose mutarotase